VLSTARPWLGCGARGRLLKMSGTLSRGMTILTVHAHCIRESSAPEIDAEGREIWLCVYGPRSQHDDPAGSARHRPDVSSSA